MKTQLLIGLAMLGLMSVGQASIYYQGTVPSGDYNLGSVANPTIFDGNLAMVTANSMNLSGINGALTGMTITLNISGGMNNGLYGYLVAPNGTAVTLMNQPGVSLDPFGATGAGMQITLASSGAVNGNIQDTTSGSVLMGNYNSAGSFAGLNGNDPDGLWTLYFSDTISGGGSATLNGWSLNLDISAVPEPTNVALGVFGVLTAGGIVCKRWRNRHPHRDNC